MKLKKLIPFLPVILLIGAGLSSCLKGDEYKPRSYSYFTVRKTPTTSSGIVLIQDMTGYKFIPSATSVKELGGLTNVERAFLEFTYQDGQSFTEGTTEFHIDLVNYGNSFAIATKDFCQRLDTLANDSLSEFPNIWAFGGYVNTVVGAYVSDRVYIDMVKERICGDTLYLHVNQNLDRSKKNYTAYKCLNSFRLPEANELAAEGIQPVRDSIVIAVSGTVGVYNGTETRYQYTKYKFE
ncbi:MAG: hypothetical protein ACI36X_01670 [Bacteroidaceae bacterium]